MKKVLVMLFIILFCPIGVFAYSNYIIPGGETIGIDINTDGLVVVGFYKVNGRYIAKDSFVVGDRIISINNIEVSSIEDLSNVINDNLDNIDVEVKRNNKTINVKMNVEIEDNTYKTGLYIKDNIIGLGSLSYIDPVTKVFGSLGHEIDFSNTNLRVEVRNGNIFESKVTGIDRSYDGYVGAKNATINYKNNLGTITKNTEFGLFGIINEIPNKELVEVGTYESIHKGEAYIYTVTEDNTIEKYKINIIDKYSSKNTNKSFGFEIVDENLLSKTGGIVQGMSGSPIIQDGKIIGAVTHVVIDKVSLGYGIYIKIMLEEGEK